MAIGCTVRAEAQARLFVPAIGTAPNSPGIGIFTTAVVRLNGIPLFTVAAPTALQPGEISAESRALLVEGALQQLVAIDRSGSPLYDASTLRVWTRRRGNAMAIVATDARHDVPVPIVTLTSADVKFQQSTPNAIATSWQPTLQAAIVQALVTREPAVERAHLRKVVEIGMVLAVWSAVLSFLLSAWQRRIRMLTNALAQEESAKLDYDAALRRSRISHDLRAVSSAWGVLFWFTVLCWFIAATWSFAQFTQTIALSRALSHGATTIVVICISVAVINRLLDLAIAQVAARWKVHHYLSPEEQARVLLRIPTTASVIGHFKTFALVLVSLFLSLSLLGLPIHSVVTIGGIAAIAGTLAAQNFLRDMIGGIAVLYEDQYAIGDLVTINDHTGNVENITLRIVMIRDLNGSAVTISHSAVTAVSNFSRNWSRIDYQQSLAPEADPDQAIGLIRDTVEQLAQDGDAGRGLLLPIEWIGVHAFTGEWTLVRGSIRTAPLQQSTLHREINRRVRRRLAEAGIPYGPAIDPKLIAPL